MGVRLMTAKTYDEKCLDLAEHFLQDEPDLDTIHNGHHLACAIQTAIEEWFEDAKRTAATAGDGEKREGTCLTSSNN
jgi:hypothetical protein